MTRNLNHFLLDCPGVVGQLARAIDSTYLSSKPAISLAAAISFFAALKAGKVESEDGIQPSLFVCLIAASGEGKTRANSIIEGLLEEYGLRSLQIGQPMSDSGLLRALGRSPRAFLLWDEFGPALSELTKTTTGHRSLILSLMMDLFSRAGKPYVGREYATQDKRIDLSEQWLTIFASSIPSRFYASLSEDFVLDGFLSRWLCFIHDKDDSKDHAAKRFVPPQTVEDAIIELRDMGASSGEGNLAFLSPPRRVVKIDGLMHTCARQRCYDEQRKASSEVRRVFLSRKYELYTKLCLVIGDVSGVDLEVGEYCEELTSYLIRAQSITCEQQLGAGPAVRLRNQILELIPYDRWISASQIHDLTSRVSGRERQEAIVELLQSDKIECSKGQREDGSRGPAPKLYRRVS